KGWPVFGGTSLENIIGGVTVIMYRRSASSQKARREMKPPITSPSQAACPRNVHVICSAHGLAVSTGETGRVTLCEARPIYPTMLLRPAYLSQKLDRPLPSKDGGTLSTIGQAVDYMTGIGKKRELRSQWQNVAKLILAKEDVLTVSRALELAL